MPDLEYQANVAPEALPGRAFPHIPAEFHPGAFGGEVGRAVETVGSVVEAVQRHADETQALDAHNQIQHAALDTLTNSENGFFTLQGKNVIGAGPQYLQRFDDQARQVIGNIPSARARLAAQNSYMQQRNHLEEQINTHTLDQTKKYGVDTAKATVGLAQQTAIANYNHPDIITANLDHQDFAIETLARQSGWSPEETQEAKYHAHVTTYDGILTNMLADNKPEMAQALFDHVKGELRPQDRKQFERSISAGQVQAKANSILGAYRQDTALGDQQFSALDRSGLEPEQISKVTQAVEQGRNELAQQRRADPSIKRTLTALDGSIASGTANEGSLGVIESLYRQGAVTDNQRLLYRDQVLRSMRKGADEQQAVDYVRDAYEKGTALDDREDKKAVNLFTATMTMGQPPGSPGYNNVAVEVTSRVGVVPDGAIHFGRASMIGGDVNQAAAGAQLYASLQRANPGAYLAATDPETRALAASINDAVSAGASPESAVTMARDNAKRSKTMQKYLDDEWNRQFGTKVNPTQLLSNEQHAIRYALKDDKAFTEPGFHLGNTVPDVPASMAADYQVLTRTYFNHFGNLEQARAHAIDDLKGTWGVTTVNGNRQLMKYAPEAMFPGLTADDIRRDLAAKGYGAAHLQESTETGASGGREWNIAEPDKFGAWQVVTENGMPLRYPLPKAGSSKTGFEERLKIANEEQALRSKKQREDFAAEHPMRQPGF